MECSAAPVAAGRTRRRESLIFALRVWLGCFPLCAVAESGMPAFPGAEGFGRFASGGRGGDVYTVTNLNDSGPGSLRDAVTNRDVATPRTVVFAVSGTIYLNSTLRITKGNLTIAGQTAPGDGICLAYRPLDISNSSNVIIRFLRVRLGDVAGVETDAFSSRYGSNIIVDHCSFSWSVDETSSTYDNTDLTLQWCFITESLRDSVHSKGAHGYGGIWGGRGASYHHNLLAHHDSRNPRFNGARTHGTADELVDMRNNIIYNWRGNSTYGGEPTDTGLPARHNMVNNIYKPGPATGSGAKTYRILEPSQNPASTGSAYSLFHITGNWTTASSAVTANNWNGGVQVISSSLLPSIRTDQPFEVPPVATQTAQDAYPLVLAYAGCRLPARDAVDTRIAAEVSAGVATYQGSKNNLPGIIDSQADVGGWPALASAPAPLDSDSDGMPDAWEIARGLDPFNPADRNLVPDAANGYTWLEIYLNELAAPAFPQPVVTTQPQSQELAAGSSFTLSVAVSGTGPFTYQWYRDAAPVPGATEAVHQLASITPADAGSWSVEIANPYGTVRSDPATLILLEQPPLVTTPPADLTATIGSDAVFSVAAIGYPPVQYQWYRGTDAIPGAESATLTLPAVTRADEGSYHVVVSNAHGSVVSSAATLAVTEQVSTQAFATDFSADLLQPASPFITPTAAGWYVLSSKNASASAAGDDPATPGLVDPRLDLTMVLTGSGVVEGAARIALAPLALATEGASLRVRATVSTRNVRLASLGLFDSAAILPHLGMNSGQLVGNSSTFATGGTQGWLGYRAHIDGSASTPAAVIEGRPAQPGTSNASQSLLVPGTSSSATGTTAVASSPAAGFSFADDATYTLTLTARREASGVLALDYTVHAGTAATGAPLASASGTVPAGSALASGFDSVAIGYRNRDDQSVSRLRVTALSVTLEEPAAPSADAYALFLAGHGLAAEADGAPDADPDGDGLPNALEFILGGSPTDATSAPLPTLAPSSADPSLVDFVFIRRRDHAELFDLAVESSSDLTVWTIIPQEGDGTSLVATPLDDTFEQVVVTAPLDGPRRFLRLRATAR